MLFLIWNAPKRPYRFTAAVCSVLLWAADSGLAAAATGAELPYVTNRSEAFALAEKEGRTVLLYTGRAVFCPGNDPRGYFFNEIVPSHPQLEKRSDKYVVCEQFTFATNVLSAEFAREHRRVADIYDKYNLKVYWPAIIVVDAKGSRISGPYVRYLSVKPEFNDTIDRFYATFQEYLTAERPMTVSQAQSNLLRAAFGNSTTKAVVGLFRTVGHSQGGQKPLILENGAVSTKYEVGAPLEFNFLRGTIQRGVFDAAAGYEESLVAITGTFPQSETYTGNILVRMNEAYFKSTIEPVGNRPDHYRNVGEVRVEAGEYYFLIYVRDDSVARALLRELKAHFKKGEDAEVPVSPLAPAQQPANQPPQAKPEPIPEKVFSSLEGAFGWRLGASLGSQGHQSETNPYTVTLGYTTNSDPSILPFERVLVTATAEGRIFEIRAYMTPHPSRYAATKQSMISTLAGKYQALHTYGPNSTISDFGNSTNTVQISEWGPQLELRFQNLPLEESVRSKVGRDWLAAHGITNQPSKPGATQNVPSRPQPATNHNASGTNTAH